MQFCHLNDVWLIEQDVHSHPWSQTNINDLTGRGAFHHVLLDDEHVIGYFYAQNIVGEVSLLNIAVCASHQGCGYGSQLLNHLIHKCHKINAESIWLEVRESNNAAKGLYHSLGFNDVDIRHNYYPTSTGRENGAIMCLYL